MTDDDSLINKQQAAWQPRTVKRDSSIRFAKNFILSQSMARAAEKRYLSPNANQLYGGLRRAYMIIKGNEEFPCTSDALACGIPALRGGSFCHE